LIQDAASVEKLCDQANNQAPQARSSKVTLIESLPLPLLFIALILPCLLLGIGGAWLVKNLGWQANAADKDAIVLTHAFAGMLYAVALGLMVINVQSSYSEVKMVVMQEANLTENLFIDASGLEGASSTDIQALARNYAEDVIGEWESIGRRNDSSLPSHESVENLTLRILNYQPLSARDQIIYAEVLSGLNDMLDQRRERLHLGRDSMGAVAWLIVILGAVITIGMTWFYPTESDRTRYLLVGTMGLMFGLMIFLIVVMDHPLLGGFRVESASFEEALLDMQAWQQRFYEI
jgi:hypothetical protein